MVNTLRQSYKINRLRGRVVKGVGHLDHVWSYGVREVLSSIPDRGNIVGWVFHPDQETGKVFSSEHAFPSKFWIYLEHCHRGEAVYRPSAPFLYEVAMQPRKKLPFRPLLLYYKSIQGAYPTHQYKMFRGPCVNAMRGKMHWSMGSGSNYSLANVVKCCSIRRVPDKILGTRFVPDKMLQRWMCSW